MTRKVLSLIAGAVIGASCAGFGSPTIHAASPLSFHPSAKKCSVRGYKSAKCKYVPAGSHSVTVPIPGLSGGTIVIPPQADDVEVLIIPIVNPCPRVTAVGFRIIVLNATTGKMEQKLQPPFHLNAGTLEVFNPQSSSCKVSPRNKRNQPLIAQSGAYAAMK